MSPDLEHAHLILVAGIFAGMLTYCDLVSVFDTPPHSLKRKPWIQLQAWWWGFVFVNAALACFLYYALREKGYFQDVNDWLGAVIAGAGYTAIIRLKFTTLPGNIPFGVETLYQGVRNVVHRQINRIIRDWRIEASGELAKMTLTQLHDRALLMIGSDSLLTEEEKKTLAKWIEDTTTNPAVSESDRRRSLALYIITERKPS